MQHLTLTLSTEIMRAPLPAPRLQELQLFILCQLESGREALFVIVTEFSRRKMIAVSWLGSPPALLCGGRTINKSIIHSTSNPLPRPRPRRKSDNAHKNVTGNFLFCGPSTIGSWFLLGITLLSLTVGLLQMLVPNGATMTLQIGILKGINNST